MHSGLFLDFLAGNREYHCTPWGMPTRNVFGWQKPCYLLGEGYAKTFKELMETTDWDTYGTGRYEKCANCMAHCGYEPTAAACLDQQSAERVVDGACAACARRVRWRRKSRSSISGRRSSSSPATSRRCWTRFTSAKPERRRRCVAAKPAEPNDAGSSRVGRARRSMPGCP